MLWVNLLVVGCVKGRSIVYVVGGGIEIRAQGELHLIYSILYQ